LRVTLLLLVNGALLVADTLHVPGDHATIQEGIDAAVNGDTVLVAPGSYVENIDFKGKAITVTSEQGPEATVIQGDGTDSVVVIVSSEFTDSVLTGFTVTNGHAQEGGGVRCVATWPTITGNVITGNTADSGGGLYVQYNTPRITHNIISGNTAEEGGGIYCRDGTPKISQNAIKSNTADSGAGVFCHKGAPMISYNTFTANTADSGGGFYCNEGSPVLLGNILCANTAYFGGGFTSHSEDDPVYLNNIICWNTAYQGGGAGCSGYPTLTSNTIVENHVLTSEGAGLYISNNYYTHASIANCIIWANTSDYPGTPWEQVFPPGPGTVYWISHCVVQGGIPGGTGIIDADPLFVNQEGGDFHIQYGSPCRNNGSSTVSSLPDLDFEGDPRIALGEADIGADEFHTHLYTAGMSAPGGYIEGRLVGVPGTTPVGLFIGTGVLPSPVNTTWGAFHLQWPYVLLAPLGAIPANGVMVLATTLPGSPPAPYDVPMQALIGLNSNSLTNLVMLEVRS
jgi:hypothetical protein